MAKTILKRVYDGGYYIVREEGGKFYFMDGFEKAKRKNGKPTFHVTEDVSRAFKFVTKDGAEEAMTGIKDNEQYTVKKIHTEFAYVMD